MGTRSVAPVVPIDGYDPLEALARGDSRLLDHVAHQNVSNILKSYTGTYDLFSEAIQNAMDAIQKKSQDASSSAASYSPRIWVHISLRDKSVTVVDNGIGMTEEQFKMCFTPNVSFKRDLGLRGQKGVGATFLAYGYNYIKLQSKQGEQACGAVLRGGRQWAEDRSSRILRPRFEAVAFDCAELAQLESGTSVQVAITGGSERPKQLDWQGARTARQWFDVLRIKTPLGGVYLTTPPFRPVVSITVTDTLGTTTAHQADSAEYCYPHEILDLKAKDLEEIERKLDSLPGDPTSKMRALPDEFKRLDCVFAIWDDESITDSASTLGLKSLRNL